MCLYTKRIFPKMAIKDIVCYKVLCNLPFEKNYRTPHRFMEIPKSFITDRKTIRNFEFVFLSRHWLLHGTRVIRSGYFHSFSSEVEAKSSKHLFYESIVVKCIIPKGTFYFKGMYNDYASKKLKFIKIL